MAVSGGFTQFVVDQLQRPARITTKRMFGGVGIYSDEHFFALIDDDRLYFKVDDTNRPDFEEEGMGPFRPYKDDRAMQYYEVPVSVLEDRDALAQWTARAVAVAERAKAKKQSRK